MVVVTGKIRGKARPRVCRGHAFTPKDTIEYEKLVRECYKKQDGRYLEGAIKALIIAYYKIPKSYTKKRVQVIRDGLEKPTKKPDADNIGKVILDSLNGVAYKDDSQIIDLRIKKEYTEELERVEFEFR
ncbi:RusA family crossover junction endodeoxyribonuclease [Clostridium perfringens]|uniref:Endodeoxyribonuclease RusA family protein n=1 Tax=Clostridium perfringens (strain ATCC 13124 / DSM 756 / JCM 1290 / NCIMB 6125 / NCTC 8237 / Type A) TaxID=195103 RepID=A0A0H2YTB4_CLOP1|nr:RusA family crossover junction endodeoxyribonuclease [Clostridium perfringens]DAL50773.1 MAG TPA_asm: Endodeoxyribonuclease RusA [Caudoviricetes sp.]ABG84295.1 endodeoxyribonuclease RusA family protein [Clostridium perfringens ATCC 13124]EHK2354933.1 RusA family crossover junction endodeoxyribonuclease [Clostridium perfringens]MDB2039180.1 RusA family crossover junction endodeoxyribonuclease [Clostridium perfringens]MDB2048252.1 RusA family crossover junction endodeoxyribonuclease [Clostrid